MRGSPRSRLLATGLAVALLVGAACSGDARPDTFLDDDALELVDDLARAGIAVFAEPGDREPLVEVADPVSPVRLLAWQVHTFERDAGNGVGVVSSELDAIAATDPGEPTAAEAVLAWALGTDTPAAALARELLDGYMELPRERLWELDADALLALDAELNAQPREDPVPPVLPELALVLFLSDLATAAEQAAAVIDATPAADDGEGAAGRLDGLRPAFGLAATALAGVRAPEVATRPCSLVLDFVNGMIADVFAAIPRLPEIQELKVTLLGVELPDVFNEVVRGLANGAVWVWNNAIASFRVVVDGVVLTVTHAVLAPIARVAAVIGTLAHIASIVRPWGFSVVGDPPSNRKAVSPEMPIPGEVRAKVELGRFDEWPEAIADCANRAGAPLPPLRPVGEDVEWLLLETPPGLLAQIDDPTGVVLDTEGASRIGYATATESPETAKGTPTVGYLIAAASVARHDTDRILDALEGALTAEFGQIAALLLPLVRPKAQQWFDQIAANLRGYAGVTGSVQVPILFHVPEDEPPARPRPRPQTPSRPDPPRPNGCGAGCGASMGDPHLITIDGLSYEFQGAGEFVLARSDSVEIQVRYEPIEANASVSVHTAVAAGVDGHRVVIDALGDVAVDGEPADVSGPVALGAGRLTRSAFGHVAVEFPDGTVMNVVGTNIWVHASPDLQATAVGLLGVGGEETGLPQLPDGTTLPPPTSPQEAFDLRYREFGPAWLVGERSLFDYEAGASTDTYYLADFPDADSVLLDLGDLDAALRVLGEQQCVSVTDPVLFERCVFDVAVTGDTTFVDTYTVTQTALAEGDRGGDDGVTVTVAEDPEPTTPVATGREGEPAVVLNGELEQYGAALHGAIEVVAGTVLLARTDTCRADVGIQVTLEPRDDGVSGTSLIVCHPEPVMAGLADQDDEVVPEEAYVWVPTGGVYDVEVDVWSLAELTDPVDVGVELFVDPSPTIVERDGDLSSFSGDYRVAGVADTVVLMLTHPDVPVGFPDPTGLDTACAILAYGAPATLGADGPWPLHFCGHRTDANVGLTGGIVVPLIVFGRTDATIPFSLGAPGA